MRWEPTLPERADPKKAARPPTLTGPPVLEIGCLPVGAIDARAVTTTDRAPEELLLGATLMPRASSLEHP